MNSPEALDRQARALHAASLESLSPRVQAQLAQRRRAALASGGTRARPARWGWVGAATTAGVLLVALQLRPPADAPGTLPAPVLAAATASPDPGSVLAEDPEFYLWLASGESQAYAVE